LNFNISTNTHTVQGAQIPVHSTQKSATSGRTSKPKPSRDTDKKLLFEGTSKLKPEIKVLTIREKIGEGAFGYVEKVEIKGKIYAGKRFRADRTFDEKIFCREFQILQALTHDHIVQYYGHHIVPGSNSPMLIMECMVTNMHDALTNPSHRDLPLSRKVVWLHGIAQGIEYLHSQSVMHRDLTANNVLLNEKALAKISDFGNSCIIGDDLGSDYYSRSLTSCPGTLAYMAPEAQSRNYGKEIDIFSFGHLSLFIGTQESSFRLLPYSYGSSQFRDEIQRRQNYFSCLYKKLKLEENHPLVTLMKECLANDPEMRPNATELVSRLGALSGKLTPPPPLYLKELKPK